MLRLAAGGAKRWRALFSDDADEDLSTPQTQFGTYGEGDGREVGMVKQTPK